MQTRTSNNTVLIVVLLVITFPFWIGIFGALIGIIAGIFGGLIGLIAGIFGGVAAIVSGAFGWVFGCGFPFSFPTFFLGKILFVAVLVFVLLQLVKQRR